MNRPATSPTFVIPDNLPPHVADDLFMFLSRLADAVWNAYHHELTQIAMAEASFEAFEALTPFDDDHDDDDFDDPIPF